MLVRNLIGVRGIIVLILLVSAVVGSEPQDVDDEVDVEEAVEEVADDVVEDVEEPMVKIFEGKLRGKILPSYSGRRIYTFLGIPYAKPPLGELRFSHPRRADKWEGVRDATKDRGICAQLIFPERTFSGDEDCLFANVFTTRLPDETEYNHDNLLDVIVLIHDGGFQFNSGNIDAYLPDHLLEHDLVLVTFNFRLGVLGFLATGDEHSPGNYGLKDQVELLAWVRRNIAHFGGNPGSVTLLGSQSGGSSAHLHLLSPMSRDSFHNAVSISGTALSPWALVDTPLAIQRAQKLGKIVGCKKKETKALVNCLRKKYTLELVTEAEKVMEWVLDYSAPFAPVVEPRLADMRPFLPLHPLELMTKLMKGPEGRWEKPWLVGVAADEALPQALMAMVFPYIMNSLNSDPGKYIPLFLGQEFTDEKKRNEIGQKAWEFYIGNVTLTYGNLNDLADLATDFNVYHGVMKSVQIQSDVSEAPIFVYRFGYDRRENTMSLGVPQGDDVEYMFPNVVAGTRRPYSDRERPIVERLTQIMANFAKHGDPTPEGSDILGVDELWPAAKGRNFHYVEITKTVKIMNEFFPKRMRLWDDIERMANEATEEKKHDEL